MKISLPAASGQRVGESLYEYLSNSSFSWYCNKYNSINFFVRSSQDLSTFASENRFSAFDPTTNSFMFLFMNVVSALEGTL